jgi:protein TonB
VRVFFLLLLSLLFVNVLRAQSRDSLKTPNHSSAVKPHFDDHEPEFPGGYDSMRVYISRNIHYPEQALKKGIHGMVVIKFLVYQDGSIINAVILRDIGYGCGEEALRVVKGMPNWIPGKMNGKPVKAPVTIPITFAIH